jgi:iron-sulfur cluster assembly protein
MLDTFPIELTGNAVEQVKTIIAKKDAAPLGLRIGVRDGGCSGMSYVIELAKEIGELDLINETYGFKLVVNPEHLKHIEGLSIDFVSKLTGAGFEFSNPLAERTCGCGSSFNTNSESADAAAAAN